MTSWMKAAAAASHMAGLRREAVLLVLGLSVLTVAPAMRAPAAEARDASKAQQDPMISGEVSEIFVESEEIRFRRPGSPRLQVMAIERRRDSDRRSQVVVRGRRPQIRGRARDFAFDYDFDLSYERVNGITIWQGVHGRGEGDFLPEIWTRTGYGFERDRWYYDFGVLQPLTPGEWLLVGGTFYRMTASRDFDEEIVGDGENTLAALFFKEDFRDYLETTGYAGLAESRLGDSHVLRGSYRREDIGSLGVVSSWSVFGRDKSFRPNDTSRAVSSGVLRAVALSYTLDKRNDQENPTRGLYWRLSAERAGKSNLDGAFHYDRYFADLRHYLKMGPVLFLDVRLAGGYLDADPTLPGGPDPLGGTGSGTHLYPVHKELYVGGIGTMPGYRHKEYRGDRMFLVNVEYRVGGGDIQAVFFADAGDAWVDDLRDLDIRTDAGIGFQEANGGFRVMVAERLDEPQASPLWWIRLQRTF